MCAVGRLTPLAAEELTAAEIRTVLDGGDWLRDRAWEIAIFQRTHDGDAAVKMLRQHYPSFRNAERGKRRRRRRFRMGDSRAEEASE